MVLFVSLAHAGLVVLPVTTGDAAQSKELTAALIQEFQRVPGMTVAGQDEQRTWGADTLQCQALTLGTSVRLDCRINATKDGAILAADGLVGRADALQELACGMTATLAPRLDLPAPTCKSAPVAAQPPAGPRTPVSLTVELAGDEPLAAWLVKAFDSIEGVDATRASGRGLIACRLTGRADKEATCRGNGTYGGVEITGRLDSKSRCTTVALLASAIGVGEPSVCAGSSER